MLMWWRSEVNFSFFLSFATRRMRSSACDTLIWPCVPHVLCWPAFLLVSALGSTGSAANSSAVDCSAAECNALFVGFTATIAARYRSEPDVREGTMELAERAKEMEKKRNTAMEKHHHYEVASAAFQIGIVLASA